MATNYLSIMGEDIFTIIIIITMFQWIGLRENLNRKPSIFPWNIGLSCKNSLKRIHWMLYWLVVWIIFYFSISCQESSQLTFICFHIYPLTTINHHWGSSTTNQYMVVSILSQVPFSCSSRIAATVTGMFDAVQGIGGALAWCNHPGPIQRSLQWNGHGYELKLVISIVM